MTSLSSGKSGSGPRIIVALDFSSQSSALALVDRLDPACCRLKVGKELFVSCGPALVENLVARGFAVFLDLKFHDIPSTVAGACRAAAGLGVWMIDVHASGGEGMLSAAREAVDGSDHRPLLVAVTVLTSLGPHDLNRLGVGLTTEQCVLHWAQMSARCGLDGVVCSAAEAACLRRELGPDQRLVTPGIRPSGSPRQDQQRVLTPAQAVAAGADYLVIGRPISRSADPHGSVLAIESEISDSPPASGLLA